MIGAVVLSLLAWVGVMESERPVLTFFGADETLLALAQTYMRTIRYAFPLFLFNQLLAAFLRNDGAPALATLGVLSGGVFNAFGDYFFVVACGMGIYGAGLATAIGSGISFLVMLTHFFSRKNTLRLVKPEKLMCKLREIAVTGFSTFFIDVAMDILTVLFIGDLRLHHSGQHLCSVLRVQRWSGVTADHLHKRGRREKGAYPENASAGAVDDGFFRGILDGAQHGVPNLYIRIFMAPTPEVLDMAPAIVRTYALSFLLLRSISFRLTIFRRSCSRRRRSLCRWHGDLSSAAR